MKSRLLAITAFLCLCTGRSPAATIAPNAKRPAEMTGLRCIVIWDGQREHLFLQARFEHTTGRMAFLMPLAEGASCNLSGDPKVFKALNRYLTVRGAASEIEEWPGLEAGLETAESSVKKGHAAREWLMANGFSPGLLQDDATYAVAVFEAPEAVAGGGDDLPTEMLYFSFASAAPQLPVAKCGSSIYFFSARPAAERREGLRRLYAETTPYYWARMLDEDLAPLRELFEKTEEMQERQFHFQLLEGRGKETRLLGLAAPTVPVAASAAAARRSAASLTAGPKPAGCAAPPKERRSPSLREELAQISGIPQDRRFAHITRNMTPAELQELVETLERRADMLRGFIYKTRSPSAALKRFWSTLETADLKEGNRDEEENARLVVEGLRRLFADRCWDETIQPILDRKGSLAFVREGRDNAKSYSRSIISQVIDRDTGRLILEMGRTTGEGREKKQMISRHRYTMRYAGKVWLIAKIEPIE